MKKIIIILFSFLFTLSCSGLLWNGENTDELTISINNPFYQGSSGISQNSRAMALQGKYLYIELALITDQALYNADSTKALTGNGTWVTKPWGGHAIVTLTLTDLIEVFEGTFTDVPKDLPLQARVLLDVSEQSLIDGLTLGNYMEVGPICYSYNPSAPDVFEPVGDGADRFDWFWKTIPVASLSTNFLPLSIRPEYFSYSPGPFDLSTKVVNVYIDTSGVTAYDSEPSVGDTKFSSFDINLNTATDYLRDPIVYLSVDSTLVTNPGILSLHDEDGTTLAIESELSAKSFQTIQLTLDDTYVKNLFVGSTILNGTPDLTEDNVALYGGETYNIGFGILYAKNLAVTNTNGDLYTNSLSIPAGFQQSDLEFSIININSAGVDLQDIETVNQVRAITPLFDSEWSTAYFNWTGLSFSYQNFVYSAPTGSWAIIIGRLEDGMEFIFGRDLVEEF